MILYCADGPFYLGVVLLHSASERKGEKIVLMGDHSQYKNKGYLGIIQKMKENGIFFDVLMTDLFFDCTLHFSEKKYEQYVIEFFDDVFEKCPYSINDFSEIVCLSDGWDAFINLYFNLIKQKYTWLCVGRDLLLEVKYKDYQNNSQEFLSMMNKYKALSPLAPYAEPEMLPEVLEDNAEILKTKKCSTWDKYKSLDSVSHEQIMAMVDSFNIPDIEEDSVIVLPNSQGYTRHGFAGGYRDKIETFLGMDRLSRDEVFAFMNKIALDYYIDEDVKTYVKPHPNNPVGYDMIKKYYGYDAELIDRIPFEIFMKYLEVSGKKIEYLLTYNTGSIVGLSMGSVKQIVMLNESYIYTWYYYDSISAALELSIYLKKNIIADIVLYEQIQLLCEKEKKEWNVSSLNYGRAVKDDNAIVIVDCIYISRKNKNLNKVFETVKNSAAVVFLNVGLCDDFFSENVGFIPLCVYKQSAGSGDPGDYERLEYIWVYSQDKVLLEKIKAFYSVKHMKRRGVNVIAKPVDREEASLFFDSFFTKKMVDKLLLKNMMLEKRLENLCKSLSRSERIRNDVFDEIENIDGLLDILNVYKNDLIIAMGIKDNPGLQMPSDLIKRFRALGFNDFSNQNWRMYAGIISFGKIIADEAPATAGKPASVKEKCHLINDGEIEIVINSESWKEGNKCNIIVNENDYALNLRGVNLVVLDPDGNCLISAVYDSAGDKKKFTYKTGGTDSKVIELIDIYG